MAYRIDNATATNSIPTPTAVGVNPNSYFTKGNPSLGVPATIVDDDWANAMQEEVCNVIEGAGITLSKTTRNQLLQAIEIISQKDIALYTTSTSAANTYTATLSPVPAAYTEGMLTFVKFTNANTGAATINFNSLGAKSIKHLDGSALAASDIAAGTVALLIYDGTNFQMIGLNPANFVTNAQFQNSSPIYAASTTAANTYTATLTPTPSAYSAGMKCLIKFTNANTSTAPTINLNSLGAKTITHKDGSVLNIGDIASGMVAQFVYDGTNFQLMSLNETNYLTSGSYQINAPVYFVDGGAANAYTGTLSPAISSYVAGLHVIMKVSNTNTSSSTINLNSLGTKTIVHSDGTNINANDLVAGMEAKLVYDGTNFQLLNRNPQNTFNPNILISGDFGTNPWQAGVTFAAAANATYTADGFQWTQTGSGVVTVKQSTTVPTVLQAGVLSKDSMEVDVTTASASPGVSDYYAHRYAMEGYDFVKIAQRPLTISFWIYTTITGTYSVSLSNSGSDQTYVASYTVSGSNTWQKITLNIPASPSSGTWNYTNGVGLDIRFYLAAGSSKTTTPGSWSNLSTNAIAATGQVNNMSSISNVFIIDLIKIESGNIATGWLEENQQTILDKCKRYYEKSYAQGNYAGDNTVIGASDYSNQLLLGNGAAVCTIFIPFSVEKRASPTITTYAPSSSTPGLVQQDNSSTISPTSNVSGRNGYLTQAINTAGRYGVLQHYISNARL